MCFEKDNRNAKLNQTKDTTRHTIHTEDTTSKTNQKDEKDSDDDENSTNDSTSKTKESTTTHTNLTDTEKVLSWKEGDVPDDMKPHSQCSFKNSLIFDLDS